MSMKELVILFSILLGEFSVQIVQCLVRKCQCPMRWYAQYVVQLAEIGDPVRMLRRWEADITRVLIWFLWI